MLQKNEDLKWKYKVHLLCFLLTKIKNTHLLKNIFTENVLRVDDYHDKYNLYYKNVLIGHIGYIIYKYSNGKPIFSKDLYIKELKVSRIDKNHKKLQDFINDDIEEKPVNIDSVILTLLWTNYFSQLFTLEELKDFHIENKYDMNYIMTIINTIINKEKNKDAIL